VQVISFGFINRDIEFLKIKNILFSSCFKICSLLPILIHDIIKDI